MDRVPPQTAHPLDSVSGDRDGSRGDESERRAPLDAAAMRAEWTLSPSDGWLREYDEVE
jgi:hypothetical protein